ncbi:MAG TPA: hypothetical protein VEX87_26420 [Skermanella sp.]|jgi:hypothetical protein|nr:hypothetical protein [Skermanella sp.]
MAMEIVNGYPCRDCSDVEKAKKGIDPNARPGETEADAKSRSGSGPLEEKDRDKRGVNRPLSTGNVGTALNILV